MFKYAFLFLIISIVAGAYGFTGVSDFARRISFILFGILFLIFLVLIGFAALVEKAVQPATLLSNTLIA
jgi:uncharacterized membrane protein YtjA (UPF0391 family)